jgi:branched-chain amino acid transport system ATP-binding protein
MSVGGGSTGSPLSSVSGGEASVRSPVLVVRDLTVRFGGVVAVDNISFDLEDRTLTGLIGPNGAGKSTLIDALSGLVPSRGRVLFEGRRLDGRSADARARWGIARTFQALELFETLSVRENLLVSAERASWWSLLSDLVRHREDPDAEASVEWALSAVGLSHAAGVLPGQLSISERKLVGVARALSARPKLVILDEPAAGLDRGESLAFGARLRRLLGDYGVTVLLVDHDMGLVLSVCDEVLVLQQGHLVARGTPAEIRDNAQVIEAYLGERAVDDPGRRLPTQGQVP